MIQFETRIFNAIRQSNIQSQTRKHFKSVLFEIKRLRDDIRKLFEYMQVRINTAQGATPGSSIMTHQDHLIAELVSAMGIGKVDYEDSLSQQLLQSRGDLLLHLENPGKSQEGTLRCSSMLPSNAVPRVNIQLSPSHKDGHSTAKFGMQAMLSEQISQHNINMLFLQVQDSLFTKDEL